MSKYGSEFAVADGIKFRSRKEARRYGELRLLEKAGEIHSLNLQPVFILTADGSPKALGKYIADFEYVETKTNRAIYEDVKGFRTPLYRWKKKHVEAQYGIQITEV